MFKILLSGWFIIRFHDIDAGKHSYLVEEPNHNYKISFNMNESLPYEENTWIKLKMTTSCTEVEEPYEIKDVNTLFSKRVFLCTADVVEELKCTERNSFVVNGIGYC